TRTRRGSWSGAPRSSSGRTPAAAISASATRLLQRNFKDVTGRTVGEALRDERLRRVRALLSETTTPIGAIAGLCGFKSDGYLKQLFRARHGCTMRDWRRRARGR
ncbi:MAG: helix-turn-helix domain-containing protein, partial [Kiritimatiellae bacterium]|nr:helix-turn-helix domain-containing protein [Kiritimatiellia bacterium]